MIKDFKVKTNSEGEVLIQINESNSKDFLANCLAVRFENKGSDLILSYDHKDKNLDGKKLIISRLSKMSVLKILKSNVIHIMEISKNNENAIYSAFKK